MSKHETPMTRWYWEQVGWTVIEEVPAVRSSPTCGQRLIDGVIVRGGEHRIAKADEVRIQGEDIFVVHMNML